jgi:hypothetical protein
LRQFSFCWKQEQTFALRLSKDNVSTEIQTGREDGNGNIRVLEEGCQSRVQCYDHYVQGFLPILGGKICSLKNDNQFLQNLLCRFWSQKCHFSRQFFRRKYYKNHNIGPRLNLCKI